MDADEQVQLPPGVSKVEFWLEIFMTVRDPRRRYTQAELAAVLGCTRENITQIQRRALKKMRAALEEVQREI